MIVLKAMLQPFWTDECPFSRGVRLHLRRLTSIEILEAQQVARAVLLALRQSTEALAPYGLAGSDALGQRLNLADFDQMVRVGVLIETVEVAKRGIIAWEGVQGEDGQPAPVELATLAVLLLDSRFDVWVRRELERAREVLSAEKNVSWPSPSGGVGAGRTGSGRSTATGAARPAGRAPRVSRAKAAGSVPKPKRRR